MYIHIHMYTNTYMYICTYTCKYTHILMHTQIQERKILYFPAPEFLLSFCTIVTATVVKADVVGNYITYILCKSNQIKLNKCPSTLLSPLTQSLAT